MNAITLIRYGTRGLQCSAALALCALLAACAGGGAPTQQNPVTSPPTVQDYTGPAPSNADVQAFKLNLWENIKASNRCGGCHHAGGQSPEFARTDDVNLAYQAATSVVNLVQPDQSRMVVKVGGGHNCWLASASACADTLTTWIRNWAGSSATGGKQIQLVAPTDRTVGASKTFPTSPALFQSTIYPLLNDPTTHQYCARCHSPGAASPQQPYFASGDVNEAYAAAQSKINLDDPSQSRFVLRLRNEFHNCWSDCVANADTMQAAIQAFANGIQPTQVDPALVLSKALTLYDGTVASGGNRYDTNQIALYEFKTGTGNIAYDTSGVEPALNLTLSGNVTWVGGWGLNIQPGGKAQGTTGASKKLSDIIKSSGEFSIEAWAAPANVAQMDAYMVSYSGGTAARNVTLSQHAYQYEVMTRSSKTDGNGAPSVLTDDKSQFAQASLQHVVMTYDPVNGRQIYVNGLSTKTADPQGGGTLANWDDTFALVLGNETSTNRQWQGVLKLVAIHNRALTLAQIQQNYAAGVGEKYFLLFNVSTLTNVPMSYIMMEGSLLDSYAYLFNKPALISLDPTQKPDNIRIKGMRIGINGAEAQVGQSYIPLDVTVSAANYSATSGQLLANIGAVIGLQKGPTSDEFFLTFEQIGTHTHAVSDPAVPIPAPPPDGPLVPDIGVRTFERLNATMAKLTGVSPLTAGVASTYASVQQALPSVPDIAAYSAANQTAISQLAIAYCSALVDSPSLRTAFFGAGFDPTQNGAYINGAGVRDPAVSALYNKLVGANVATQPAFATVQTELNALINKLATNPAINQPNGAGLVAKAACGSVLGSAATILQ